MLPSELVAKKGDRIASSHQHAIKSHRGFIIVKMGNGGSKVAGGEEEDGNGGDSSVSRHKASVVQRSTAEVVKLMFPVYYVEERISPDGWVKSSCFLCTKILSFRIMPGKN